LLKPDRSTSETTEVVALLLGLKSSNKLSERGTKVYNFRNEWYRFLRHVVEATEFFSKTEPKSVKVSSVTYNEVIQSIAQSVHKTCFPHIKKLEENVNQTLISVDNVASVLRFHNNNKLKHKPRGKVNADHKVLTVEISENKKKLKKLKSRLMTSIFILFYYYII